MSEENTEVVDQETEATEESSNQNEAVEASGEESQEEVKSEAEKQEEVKQELLRQIKLKVDGKEEAMELPFEVNEEQAEWLKRHIQPAKAAQKRFQEVSQEKKRIEEAVKNFQKDPAAALEALGINAHQFAEQFMINKLEEQNMTPEEREARAMKQKLANYEAQEKQRKEQEETNARNAAIEAKRKEFGIKITNALDASNLPKSDSTQKRMAEYMLVNAQNGMDLPMESIVEMVREDYLGELKDLFDNASGDQVLNTLGKDLADKIRKADLAQLKKAPKVDVKKVNNSTEKKKEEPDFISPDEFKAYLEKRNKK